MSYSYAGGPAILPRFHPFCDDEPEVRTHNGIIIRGRRQSPVEQSPVEQLETPNRLLNNQTDGLARQNNSLRDRLERLEKQNIAAARQSLDNDLILKAEIKMLQGLVADLKQEADRHATEQESFKTETDKHAAEQVASQQEIARLEKARRDEQANMSKLQKAINQLRAENVANLAQLNVARQDKADLEARVFQMYTACRLQRSVDELTEKLGASQLSIECSRQTCTDTQNQLRATHDKLVSTQEQLEIVVESNNELHHRIDANQMLSDFGYVNVQPSSAPWSSTQTISQSADQFELHHQLTIVEHERDEAHRKLRAIAHALDGDYMDCFSPQQRHANNEALRNRYEKIESMLDVADAANESLESSNLSLRELLLAILTDMEVSDLD